MKAIDIVSRAGRNLKRAKMRTLLTSLAIAVGGFAITASLMAGEGARQYVDRIISSNVDPNGVMIAKDENLVNFGSAAGNSQVLREYNPSSTSYYGNDYETLSKADLDKLNSLTYLENVQPYYQVQPEYVEFEVKSSSKFVSSVSMRDQDVKTNVVAGKMLDKGVQLSDGEAAIPESYLDILGKSAEEAVGSKVRITIKQSPQEISEEKLSEAYLRGGEDAVVEIASGKTLTKEYTIASVTKKSAEQIGSPESVHVSPEAARDLSSFSTEGTPLHHRYLLITATAKDKDSEEVKEALKQEGYSVSTVKDLQSFLFQFVGVLQNIVMAFGALSLIVSVFGIVNTMYISVLERTQQIGLMKALGASRRDIGRLFRYEAAWVGFIGGAIGVFMAWLTGLAFNPGISTALNLGENHLLIFQPLPALFVIIGLMLVATVAGLLPSRKAAKLDPIEALRTE